MKQIRINKGMIDAVLRCSHFVTKIVDNIPVQKTEFQKTRDIIANHHSECCKRALLDGYQLGKWETQDELVNLPISDQPFVIFDFKINTQEVELNVDALIAKRIGSKKLSIEPIFFSLSRKLGPSDRSLAIVQSRLIENVIGYRVSKSSIFLLGADKPTSINATVRVAEKNVIESLNMIVRGEQQKTFAKIISFCKQCPFERACHEELKSRDDLSLLGGMSKNEIKASQSRGIFTVNQLSHSYRPRKRPETAKPKFYASLRAMAIREAKIYIAQKPTVPADKTDIFVDVEGIPDIDFYYLIGVHVRTSRGIKTYSFWANGQDDERKNWVAFLQLLVGIKDYRLFHYGSYEKTFFAKMRKRYRLSEEDTQTFEVMKGRLVNVVSLIYGQIYFPTFTNGLKDIGAYLGMKWSNQANGLLSVAWRDAWETSGDSKFKAMIEKYNTEDCIALLQLVDFLRKITDDTAQIVEGKAISSTEGVKVASRLRWGKTSFLISDFEQINKCAYFDYQSSKIFFGKDRPKPAKIQRRKPIWSKVSKVNKIILHDNNLSCPLCGTDTYKHGSYSKIIIDLKFINGGIKRWAVKHVGMRRRCQKCRHVCLVPGYPTHGPSIGPRLCSYAVYMNIALRLSFGEIREHFQNVFGVDIGVTTLSRMKQTTAQYYEPTVKDLMRSLKKGPLLQVDETNAKLDGRGCYVWVFASLSEVVYLHADTRKGDILHRHLRTFKGVLVSDFYAAYDSIQCLQQKCLIHLIRDFNDDLFKNQLNDEFKALATEFATLMKGIIETIDRSGMRARYLAKHKKLVRKFYRKLKKANYHTEISQTFQKRLLKNENKLFVFLDYDNVPWNNNYAENAIKTFAEFRSKFNSFFQKNGLKEYLVLLSIQHTCKLRKINFLQFLLSGRKTLPPRR